MATAARSARVARARSGQSACAMLQTACTTTATVAIFKPCNQPALPAPSVAMPKANKVSASADGKVKPSQAANAPGRPARAMPIAMPTWLLAGPGRN